MNRFQVRLHSVSALLIAGAASSLTPPVLAAQSSPAATSRVPWALVNAIGYGGLGFGVGLAGAFAQDDGSIGSGVALIGLTTALGFGAGIMVGHDASKALASGRPVPGATRVVALSGLVLAGTTAGALAAVPLINGGNESGTFIGSDETTVAVTTAAGTVLGVVLAARQRHFFDGTRTVSVAPFVARQRGQGVRVTLRF